jgi:dethiobiotin synthetase
VTGSGTGVGKTLLTALLVLHLQRRGVRVRAVKPFSAGSLADARLLNRLQRPALSLREVAPLRFRAALAPWVAARLERRSVPLAAARRCLQRARHHCGLLVVEGCGGLLTPLGPRYTLRDLIPVTRPSAVIIVVPNRLGALNQSLLTLAALAPTHTRTARVVLTTHARSDRAARTNSTVLTRWLRRPTFEVPALGPRACAMDRLAASEKKLEKVLARLIDFAIFAPLLKAAASGLKTKP